MQFWGAELSYISSHDAHTHQHISLGCMHDMTVEMVFSEAVYYYDVQLYTWLYAKLSTIACNKFTKMIVHTVYDLYYQKVHDNNYNLHVSFPAFS
jgi:hypothetical protein